MQVILRKLTDKNQIALPAHFLTELQIRPADTVEISQEDKSIRIKKAKGLGQLYGSFATGKSYSIKDFKEIAKQKFIRAKI